MESNVQHQSGLAVDLETKFVGELSWKYLSEVQIGLDTYLDDFKKLLLPRVRPEWDPSRLGSTVLDGGVTNALFAIFDSDQGQGLSSKDVVLLRVNGTGTDDIISRTDEIISLLTLHHYGLSPPVYAQLKNGLCYGFLKGNPLSITDVKECVMMKRVAKSVAKLHSLDIPHAFMGRKPHVWYKAKKWLAVVQHTFDDPIKQKCFSDVIGSVKDLERELYEIEGILRDCHSPVVFCHNDLFFGNLIYNKDTDTVGMIDFEYAGPNYLAYDIADHFCEFAGVDDVDYSRYPSEDLQKQWLQAYLEEAALLRGDQPSSVSQADVHELYRAVNKFSLSCHLFWTIWSLFQEQHSVINFNYLEYAGYRFSEYKRRKQEFLAL